MALSAKCLSTRHQWFALVLLVVLGFLAVAQFTPLHQHSWDGSCSLNGFDDVVLSQAVLMQHLFVPSGSAWLAPLVAWVAPLGGDPSTFHLRGPPAVA